MANKISVRNVKIIYTVCPAIAILFTFLRLWLRARTAKLWYDDGLAFMAAVFTGLTAAGGWMHFDAEKLDSNTTKIAAYYMVAQSFYGSLWCARLSILYSIIRIASNPQMRKFLHWLAVAMVFAWAILFSQIFWVCVLLPYWTSLPAPQCPLTLQVAVLQLVSDILADGFLIAVPVRLFLNSQLQTGTKLRLMVIFSASILTTVVSLVHAYYLLRAGGADVLIAAIVEIAVSVIVCNLSIVVTSFSRVCRRKRSTTSDEDTEERDESHVRTFGAWSPKGRKKHGEITTFGLTTINVSKESETYVDMGGATDRDTRSKGQLETIKGPVVYYESHDQVEPQKAYLPASGEHW